MNVPLIDADIQTALSVLPGWQGDTRGLVRHYKFRDFVTAMAFMQACIPGIEERNHHPEWCNGYNRLRVKLFTHDAGDQVTTKDVDLALHLDEIAGQHGGT